MTRNSEAHNAYNLALVSQNKKMGGSVESIFNKGGADLMNWLADQTPNGATVSETMAAICLDAMIEERESK